MKLLRLLIFTTFVGMNAFSAAAQSAGAALASTNKITKHCLWQAKGVTNTVFLLGSMHMMKETMYPLAPEIEAAYKRASVVTFEADVRALESPPFASKLMAKATYPEGESLKKKLSPAIYSLLVSNLQSSLVTVETLNQFRPWMAAMTIAMTELQKQGFDVQSGVDRHFLARAIEDQKTLDYFETPEFQVSLFTELTDKESEELLGQMLRDMDVWKKEFDLLAKAWITGDIKALEKLILDSFREYPLMHRKLLLDRNRAWIAKLEQMLNDRKDVLVVVGAGHLIGKDSVVDLLTAKGHKVEQL